MALQSSGQISLNDIKTELGAAATNVSLRSMSATAGKTSPDAISEFYGYSSVTPNDYYWQLTNGSNGELRWEDTEGLSAENDADWSISFWYRNDQSSKTNLLLIDIFPQGASNNHNRIFLNYNSSQNRFVARYRSSAVNFDRQWNLHNNSTATGVSNSTTGWCTSQRGRVNSQNFTHIVLTYKGTESTGAAAFKCYWNGIEMTTTAASANGTRSNFNKTEFVWSNDYNDGSGDNSSWDMMHLYQTELRSADVTALYNSGTPITHDDSGISADLKFEDRAETTTPTDSSSTWSLKASNGSRQAYP